MHSAKMKRNLILICIAAILSVALVCVGWNIWRENNKTTSGELDYVAMSSGFISVLPRLDTANSVYTAALTDLQAANYKQAEQGFSQLIGNWSGSDADLTRVRLALAVTYTALGKYDETENLYQELDKQYRFVFGKNRIEKLLLKSNKAILITLRFTYEDIPNDLDLVYEDAKKQLQEGDPFISVAACNASQFKLSTIDSSKEDTEKVGPALNNLIEVFGEEHVTTAMAYAVSAYSYGYLEEIEIAQENYEKSEQLFTALLGKDHPVFAYVYSVKEMYAFPPEIESFDAEDYKKCVEVSLMAAQLLERTIGSEHVETGQYYTNIASLCNYAMDFHTKQGNLEEADRYWELTLQYAKKAINSNETAEQRLINRFAELELVDYYNYKGDYTEALKWSLEVYKNNLYYEGKQKTEEELNDAFYNLVKQQYGYAGNDLTNFDEWLENQTE